MPNTYEEIKLACEKLYATAADFGISLPTVPNNASYEEYHNYCKKHFPKIFKIVKKMVESIDSDDYKPAGEWVKDKWIK